MSCYPQTFQCFIGDHHKCIGEVPHRHIREHELVAA